MGCEKQLWSPATHIHMTAGALVNVKSSIKCGQGQEKQAGKAQGREREERERGRKREQQKKELPGG